MGSPGIIHDRTLINDLTTEHSVDWEATRVIDVLGLFSDMIYFILIFGIVFNPIHALRTM